MNHQEPIGCEPATHWEERVLAMEFFVQEFFMIVGSNQPKTDQAKLIKLAEVWTVDRDRIRAQWRMDK